jgi:hypothetical protein
MYSDDVEFLNKLNSNSSQNEAKKVLEYLSYITDLIRSSHGEIQTARKKLRNFLVYTSVLPLEIQQIIVKTSYSFNSEPSLDEVLSRVYLNYREAVDPRLLFGNKASILAESLEEAYYSERSLQWLHSAFLLALLKGDNGKLSDFIQSVISAGISFSDYDAKEIDFLKSLLLDLYKQRTLFISKSALHELKKRSFFQKNTLLNLEKEATSVHQSFNQDLRDNIAILLLKMDPRLSDSLIDQRSHPLRTYELLKESKAPKETMDKFLEEFKAVMNDLKCTNGQNCLTKLQAVFLQKELNLLSSSSDLAGGFIGSLKSLVKNHVNNFHDHLFKTENSEDGILEIFKNLPNMSEESEDQLLRCLFLKLNLISNETIQKLKQIFDQDLSEKEIEYSPYFKVIREYFTQLNIGYRPDAQESIAEGLEYQMYNNPQINVLLADPKQLSLRVVHAPSWSRPMTMAHFLNENPSAYAGINGGFWSSYSTGGLLSSGSKFLYGQDDESAQPLSLLKTPKGLVSDSKDYYATRGWKETEDGVDVHASYLKTKWHFHVNGKKLLLERQQFHPYIKEYLLEVELGKDEKYLVYIKEDKTEKLEKLTKELTEQLLDRLKETHSFFSLHTQDRNLLTELKEGISATVEHTFYVPIDDDHSKEDDSQDAVWKSVDYMMTGSPFLVQNGVPNKDASFNQSTLRSISIMLGTSVERSALCYRKDGKWLLVTFRKGSPEQMSVSLTRIGCLHAINLDGGPSARIRLQDGTSSDSEDRKISDALLFFPK